MRTKIIFIISALLFLNGVSFAFVREYDLRISYKNVNFTGSEVKAMSVNDTIPGPTLRFKEDDIARIHVHNEMGVETSIH